MKQRYSIKPILREDKLRPNGQAPLYFSIILNKRVIRIPTGKSISMQSWDKEKSKVKGGGLAGELNQFLTTKVNNFQTFMLQQETLGKTITPDFIKGYFGGNSSNSFYEFWQQQIKRSNLKPITLKNYETTFNRLKEYHPNPTFADLTGSSETIINPLSAFGFLKLS